MRLIVIGFGVVGQSFAKLLLSRSFDLYTIYGINPKIVACVDSCGSAISPTGLDLQRLLEVKKTNGTVGSYSKSPLPMSITDIIDEIDAELVIELTPTNLLDGEPALSNITSGMRAGKHVITVNKGPLALASPSLLELADYNNVLLRFSGTVGGGTPVLEFAKRCLNGDRIIGFKGILNGTTNFILTKMEEHLPFEEALDYAERNGYVEANPSLDIDGYDAAAKLVIMSNWIMGMKATMREVSRTGIRMVNLSQVESARKRKKAIKLIAECENGMLTVGPKEINKVDPICVNGTLNAVTFASEHSGFQTIIGKGAGGMETATAILRDLIDIKISSTKRLG
ncbi:MAG TPA: homoserine dehydrogenase [Nitrososphaeraceae archaeon]|nr:homoserine dehydrogenase [Nitrososphaeraceae archaeon]